MSELILTLNAGSSSIKFAVYDVVDGELLPGVKGQVEGIGTHPHFVAKDLEGRLISDELLGAGARRCRPCQGIPPDLELACG